MTPTMVQTAVGRLLSPVVRLEGPGEGSGGEGSGGDGGSVMAAMASGW
jgi:hypothetical protein